ncbi:probable aminopeptidase NPEPL1 [Limulus polyphemus]|uniref:Probable aminopeptidase NPEPL1 n=1 Tax=Limulus polyphemus TaxID=6850 RepID=A0ABM1SUK7_LIMPO|nr:probable aminopeptidase NPEPL1 [Limulus polyphemus]XP_022247313.1 probable aminopeptidase NPEPL1 [Limulus polyphemus]
MPKGMIKFDGQLSVSDPHRSPVLIIGQTKHLSRTTFNDVKMKLEPKVTEEIFKSAVEMLHPSPTDICSLYLNLAAVAALPTKCSRHNSPAQGHAVTKLVKNWSSGTDEFIVIICEKKDAFASACAVARAYPLYSTKSSGMSTSHNVMVEFLLVDDESLNETDLRCLTVAAEGVQLAARIVDTPCSEMNTTAFLKEIEEVGVALGIKPMVIQGHELDRKGFGGIFSVGKAASHPPALAVLSHTPEGAQETIAWVGKGIVYDTGGLCIKAKTAMTGMKRDCGGAAGILGAFYVSVKMGFRSNLHAVFCLAENAVGPNATRPDDIITMYSGRTVEINNTDAEGRLVLGDGVAYAQKDLHANIIVDMATLTGAQGTATGKYHAALLTNNSDWEHATVQAGKNCGDLVHPVPYCPELHFSEFASALADMKNSVADRSNAQPSCAGLFIGANLGFDYPGVWVHVDMAYPVHCGERATGYGVALLATLFGHKSEQELLRNTSPFEQANGPVLENASKKIRLV